MCIVDVMSISAPRPTVDAGIHPRIAGLDIARGIAVLGTFATNVWLFTHPAGLYGTLVEPLSGLDSELEVLVYRVLSTLSNGKFLALLMMMFGIGVTLQFAAWQRRSFRTEPSVRTGWLRTYAPRAGVLLLDGLVNFVLIAEFDILMGYAFTGFVVAAIIATCPRTMRIWAWAAGTVHTLVILLLSAALLTLPATGHSDSSNWQIWRGINPYREAGFFELAAFRLDNALLFRAEPILTFAMGICLFLVGARLYAGGIFSGAGARLRRRCMLLGAAAAPVDLALGIIGSPAAVMSQRYLTAACVAVGLLALIAHVCLALPGADAASRPAVPRPAVPRPRGARIRLHLAGLHLPGLPFARRSIATAFRAAGRMSLTCYVGQNLLAGALFLGWGLDLVGRFPDARLALSLIGFVAVVGLTAAFAVVWQRQVRGPAARGPLEWLTHTALQRTR